MTVRSSLLVAITVIFTTNTMDSFKIKTQSRHGNVVTTLPLKWQNSGLLKFIARSYKSDTIPLHLTTSDFYKQIVSAVSPLLKNLPAQKTSPTSINPVIAKARKQARRTAAQKFYQAYLKRNHLSYPQLSDLVYQSGHKQINPVLDALLQEYADRLTASNFADANQLLDDPNLDAFRLNSIAQKTVSSEFIALLQQRTYLLTPNMLSNDIKPQTHTIKKASYSPDGKYLAIIHGPQVNISETENGLTKKFFIEPTNAGLISALCWHPIQPLVTVAQGRRLSVKNIATTTTITSFVEDLAEQRDVITQLQYSNDGSKLAAIFNGALLKLVIYDLVRETRATLDVEDPEFQLTALQWQEDNTTLLLSSTIGFFETSLEGVVAEGNLDLQLFGSSLALPFGATTISFNGRYVLYTHENAIVIHDQINYTIVKKIDGLTGFWSTDGDYCICLKKSQFNPAITTIELYRVDDNFAFERSMAIEGATQEIDAYSCSTEYNNNRYLCTHALRENKQHSTHYRLPSSNDFNAIIKKMLANLTIEQAEFLQTLYDCMQADESLNLDDRLYEIFETFDKSVHYILAQFTNYNEYNTYYIAKLLSNFDTTTNKVKNV